MQKSVFALATLAALATSASAQSSVTIYGSVDLAVTKGNGGTAANAGANGTKTAWIEKQSSSSRLGFRGNEDIGGGLSAQFQIEHRFTPDDGCSGSCVAANPFWFGRSYVQLSSETLGRVYLGRDYTPAFFVEVKLDPFGNDGVGQFGADISWAGYLTPTNAGGTVIASGARTSNTVGYKMPTLRGFDSTLAVALGEGVVPRDTGFNVQYASGPIYAGFAYEKLSGNSSATGGGNSLWNLGATYDFGFVKPGLYYASAKVNGGTLGNKVFELTASAPIGAGVLKAAYGRETRGAVAPAVLGNISKFALGYNYFLSKRTNVYADASLGRQGDSVSATGVVTSFTNNTAYAIGLKHTF